jgi:hypothetical protein
MTGKRIVENKYFPILFILLIGGIVYLPFLGRQGFYRDDWYQIWAGTTQGSGMLLKMFSIDRPLHGMIYVFTHKLLGNNLVIWHLCAFLARVTTASIFYWLLQLIWPEQKIPCLIMASLSIIYPGFLEQPFADTFINLYLVYGLSMISIAVGILAYRSKKRINKFILMAISLLTGLFYLTAIEYLIGMELVRMTIFFFITDKRDSNWLNEIKGTIKLMIPYFAMLLIFIVWRLFIFKSTRNTTDIGQIIQLFSLDPWNMVLQMISNSISGIYNTIVQAWSAPFYSLSLKLMGSEFIAVILISVLSALGFYYFLSNNLSSSKNKKWTKTAVLIGILTVFMMNIPLILLNRKVNFEGNYDRYTFNFANGVTIFLVGLVFWIERKKKIRILILTMFFAIAIFTQLSNGIHYTKFWDMQRSLWWQLSWRAPGIKSDTSVVVFSPAEYRLAEAYEIWAPLNMIYSPSKGLLKLTAEVPTSQTIPLMMSRATYGEEMRRINYTVDFKQLLVLTAPRSGICMHVLDKGRNEISSSDDITSRFVHPVSDIELIDASQSSKQPPVGIFGAEPVHDWCYYFQKASLARQQENWEEIVALGENVMAKGYQPIDPYEWLPFYEGFARAYRTDLSNQIGAIIRQDANLLQTYCKPYQNFDFSKTEKIEIYLITNLCSGLID